MPTQRQIEIFSDGCPAYQKTIEIINKIAYQSCDEDVLDMSKNVVPQHAKSLSIPHVPAVVIAGKLADCCAVSAPDKRCLHAALIGNVI